MFFQKPIKQEWFIYDVTGKENNYSARKMYTVEFSPSGVYLLIIFVWSVFAIHALVSEGKILSGLIILLMILLITYLVFLYIKKKKQVDIANQPSFILKAIDKKSPSTMKIRIKQILEILFVLMICFLFYSNIRVLLFCLALSITVSNIYNDSDYVPNSDKRIKYEIIEKEEK